jgi:hypothetical protein
MLTVLTQIRPFVSANPEWTYGHPDGRSRPPSVCPHVVRDRGDCSYLRMAWQRQAAAFLEARGIASFPRATRLAICPYL